jgi:hypothetical protein
MNAISNSKTMFHVGYRDESEFWSRGEYPTRDEAFRLMESLHFSEPEKQWVMLRVVTNTTVEMETII